jgi:hypothetical protein
MSYATIQYAEACLWWIIAIICPAKRARRSLLTGIALISFGASDVVEAQTGAWWRPWWLLAWKGACVVAILTFTLRHFLLRRDPQARPSTTESLPT